jgi:hypothetical protein
MTVTAVTAFYENFEKNKFKARAGSRSGSRFKQSKIQIILKSEQKAGKLDSTKPMSGFEPPTN